MMTEPFAQWFMRRYLYDFINSLIGQFGLGVQGQKSKLQNNTRLIPILHVHTRQMQVQARQAQAQVYWIRVQLHCTDICKINWDFLASLHGNTCYFHTDNGVLDIWRCSAELLKFRPELTEREWADAYQDPQRWANVFLSAHTRMAKWFPRSSNWGKVHFFSSTFECRHEIELHYVSKCQVRTLEFVRFELPKLSGAQRYK